MPHIIGSSLQSLCWPTTEVDILWSYSSSLSDDLEAKPADGNQRQSDVGGKEVRHLEASNEGGKPVEDKNRRKETDADPCEVRLEP
jgi:hypothetical protein